jgi:hypothetical protein
MSLWTRCMGMVFLTVAGLGTAQAVEFDVGRATVVFATDDWSAADLADEGASYGGDRSGVIRSETKLFVKTAAQGRVEAVAVVRASSAGVPAAYMTYTRDCDPTREFFAEGNTGSGMRVARCLKVYGQYTTQSLLTYLGEAGRSVLAGQNGTLPESMYVISSYFWNSNGSFVSVQVWLAPGFEGLPGTVSEALPEGVQASHVIWGRALNSAVRSSVTSIFGNLAFPPLSFKATTPTSGASRVAHNTSPSR